MFRTRSKTPRRLVLTLTVLAGLYAVSNAFSQSATQFRIEGVVTNDRSHSPIAHCHIAANLGSPGSPARFERRRRGPAVDDRPSTETDAVGQFILTLPSAGAWQLYASCRGFQEQALDQHENFFSSVVLTTSAPSYKVAFALKPDSSISGFVRDEAGDGVRNARVTLYNAPSEASSVEAAPASARSSTVDDDRGFYDFPGLPPGNYRISVQAEPWYAAASQGRSFTTTSEASLDSLLDVVYPQTWFPRDSDPQAAEVLSLQPGEDRQADFNLLPVPSVHLRLSASVPQQGDLSRGLNLPSVDRVTTDRNGSLSPNVRVDSRGQIDVGGMTPGLYRVSSETPASPESVDFIRIPAGASQATDLSAKLPIADVTLTLQGDSTHTDVVLTDVDTGDRFTSSSRGSLQRRHGTAASDFQDEDRKLQVPAGRYTITLSGDKEVYLSGVTAKALPIQGRTVTLAEGKIELKLTLKRGRASIHGIAIIATEPVQGAMVMLVPVTFGEPGSLTSLRRDQTNTDGSFSLADVIPGNYILLAIDHGWSTNWQDSSTLRRYLLHGIPLSVQSNVSLQQDLRAQKP